MTREELAVAVKHFDIDDAKRFGRCIIHTIAESPTKELRADDSTAEERMDCFTTKCYVLIRAMINQGLVSETLQALVQLKASLYMDNKRLNSEAALDPHEELDEMIQAFVDPAYIPEYAHRRCDKLPHPKDHSKHTCNIRLHALRWSSGPKCIDLTFWDFASSARILRTAYMAQQRHTECPIFGGCCFHMISIDVLYWLQINAWTEIRTKILLTVGTILPPELTNEVITYTLAAEGMPPNPEVWETIVVEPPKSKRYLQPRRAKRVNEIYRCNQMQDPNPSIVF